MKYVAKYMYGYILICQWPPRYNVCYNITMVITCDLLTPCKEMSLIFPVENVKALLLQEQLLGPTPTSSAKDIDNWSGSLPSLLYAFKCLESMLLEFWILSSFTTSLYYYISYIYNYSCPSVRPLWKVSRNDLSSRHKVLYHWLLTERSYNQAISVSASQDTSYRHKHQLFDKPYKNQATMDTYMYKPAVS